MWHVVTGISHVRIHYIQEQSLWNKIEIDDGYTVKKPGALGSGLERR